MRYLIKNALIVNENDIISGSVLVENNIISKIFENDHDSISLSDDTKIIDAECNYLIPGVIDDQVHFREPGNTYKADIYTESKAAVAGGVTSYFEMPNTNPQTTSIVELEKKFDIAKEKSLANYSFYMGGTNENIEEIKKIDKTKVCGLKVFMGSSTGNMLVDQENALVDIFTNSPVLIATHCEDEATIQKNNKEYKEKYGDDVPMSCHPEIRSAEACYLSTKKAVDLAKKHNARLHVLHLSTEKEMELFESDKKLEDKKITAEVCVHHLWFDDRDYQKYGTRIKWNPAVKAESDKKALFNALMDGKIDVVATDHAPHTEEEKDNTYFKSPSGGPLVQHSLNAMLEFVHLGKMAITDVVQKMCHNPAILFNVKERGFIKVGYKADLVLVNIDSPWVVKKDNILYKCGWSPFEGTLFNSKITHTFVNGNLVYNEGVFNEDIKGERIEFDR
ncbi:MAG: dihydroorotase [Bacteroidales bacterium]|nr:dihydroorotase [Bacteroidales bacterium]